MLMNRINVIVTCAALLIAPSSLFAVPASIADSSAFDFRYEMNVAPNNQDLDNNNTDDWFDTAAPSVAGGIASGGSGNFFRSDFSNSISRANFSDDDPFTIEVRVRVLNSGTEGSGGTLSTSFNRDNDDSTTFLQVSRTGQNYNTGVDGATVLGSNDNTDGFHTFRHVRESNGDIFIYRDNVLLNPGGTALSEDSDVNGATGMFIGDTGGATSGDWELDYVRIAQGAFAPAPVVADAHIQLGFDFTDGTVASQNAGIVVDDSGTPGSSFEVRRGDPTYNSNIPTDFQTQNVTGIGSVDLTGGQHSLQSILTVAESGLTNAAIAAAGGITMETWVNVNSSVGTGNIMSIGDAFVLVNEDGQFSLLTNSGGNPTPTVFIDEATKTNGEWIHLAGVFTVNPGTDDNTSALYLNGELVDIVEGLSFEPVFDAVGGRRIMVGSGFNFEDRIFDGLVYEPRISLGALSPSQFTIAVPEPTTAALLLGSTLLFTRRKRKGADVA